MGNDKKNGEPLPDLLATAQINPDEFSPQTNSDRLRSTFYAMAGFVYLVTRQPSIRWLLGVTIVVLGLALWLQVDLLRWTLLLLAIGLVWTSEALNTAIEAAVNIAAQEYHPMAKVSKDVAAAATFIASLVAALVAALTILPPLFERLGGA